MEQDAQIAEWEREQGICHTHGGPRDECDDPERVWFPQRRICHATMERAAAEWRYSKMHDAAPYHDGTFPTDPKAWASERSASHPYSAHDGVTIWVAETDLSPHDHFLGGAKDCDECQEVDGGNTP